MVVICHNSRCVLFQPRDAGSQWVREALGSLCGVEVRPDAGPRVVGAVCRVCKDQGSEDEAVMEEVSGPEAFFSTIGGYLF